MNIFRNFLISSGRIDTTRHFWISAFARMTRRGEKFFAPTGFSRRHFLRIYFFGPYTLYWSEEKSKMPVVKQKKTIRNYRRRRKKTFFCRCCRRVFPFCWRCRCGFAICQKCMNENAWGMSCNGITWQCPDCGGHNGLGNQ